MTLGNGTVHRSFGRGPDELRPVTVERGLMKFAEGSCRIDVGDTQVLVSATVENRVPPFLVDSGKGWLTAEYAMLPRATSSRSVREVQRGRPSGRSSEIQRLIGRSLRAAVDLRLLGERTLVLDCDVLQADGGTRTAAVTGAYIAAVDALGRLFLSGDLDRWPVIEQIAAVSVGIVGDQPLLDLDAGEDQTADVDMNVVASAGGTLVEVQGTGERRSYTRDELDHLLDLAFIGIRELKRHQDDALATLLEEVVAARSRRERGAAKPKDEADLWGRP